MNGFLIAATGVFLCASLRAETVQIIKVNSLSHPSPQAKAVEGAIMLNQTGHFRYMRAEEFREPSYELAVRWSLDKALESATLRLEYRQAEVSEPRMTEIQLSQLSSGSRWSRFVVIGGDYKQGGDVYAWKVSVLSNGKALASKKSLLWTDSTIPVATSKP